MKNAFSSENYPNEVPRELSAGSRWAWTRSDITAAYPTATYTLRFRFSQLDSPFSDYTFTAGKVSSSHVLEVSQAETSLAQGEYKWQAEVVRDSDSEEVIVDAGTVHVLPDLANNPGESSSWVYQVLTKIRATIEGTASKEDSSYSIGGRSLARRSIDELLQLEREFLTRWNNEKAAANRKAGRRRGRVLAKMSA